MRYDELMEKLGTAHLDVPPAMQDIMHRVRRVGLHKVAAHRYGVDSLQLSNAVHLLGIKLAEHHLRTSKVAAGMRALVSLTQDGDIKIAATPNVTAPNTDKVANLFRLGASGVESAMPAAGKALKRPPKFLTKSRAAPVGGHGDIFSRFKANKDGLNMKQTLRGDNLRNALPEIRPLPQG